MGNFKEDIVKTEAFIFDVDGVMTDGGIMPLVDGDFIRKYYAKDGYAIVYALRMGYKVCIITADGAQRSTTGSKCWDSQMFTWTAWTKYQPCRISSHATDSIRRTLSTWATTSRTWSV